MKNEQIPVPKPNAWALNETIFDANKSAWNSLFNQHTAKTLYILSGSAIWVLIIVFFISSHNLPSPIWFFLMAIPLFVIIGYVANIFIQVRHQFYRQFADANGMIYVQNGQLPGLEGALFNIGHSKKTEDIVSGRFDGNAFEMFTYRYTTGSGKHQQTHYCTVARVEYPSILPPIMMTVDNQYFGGLVPIFSNWVKLEPAAGFDKNFDLYAQKKLEIEALQIFTPDVLEKLLLEWPQFNLEFKDNIIYVFCNHTITKKTELEQMHKYIKFLIAKIEPIALRMKSSLETMTTWN